MNTLDELDTEIIHELRADARISIQQLAKKLDKRRATIHARINKLVESKIIKGYTIVPDFKQIGFGITAFVLVSISQDEYKDADSTVDLSSRISEIPQICEIHSVSGEYDYLLKIRVDNLETLGKEIIYTLRRDYGAVRTLTFTSFYTGKEELGNDYLNFLT